MTFGTFDNIVINTSRLLARARRLGYSVDFPCVLGRMRAGGIWYSDKVIEELVRISGA